MHAITRQLAGFSVLLGPPLTVDYDLVIDWIALVLPQTPGVDRLYQISYVCRIQSQETVFAKQQETEEEKERVHQIVLKLNVGGASTGPFKVVRRQGLRQGMNHAELLADKYSQLDVFYGLFLQRPLYGQLRVNLFHTEGVCGPTFTLFDYPFSVVFPVEALQSLEGWHQPGAPPAVRIYASFFKIPGCNLRQNGRSSAMLAALSTMNGTAALDNEFAIFIGPPMTGDCGLVSDWISLGDQGDSQDFDLYEISYLCRWNNGFFANELSVLLAKGEYKNFEVIDVYRLWPGRTNFSVFRLENEIYDGSNAPL
ncbi:unnamed protein product [Dibothriocephalus latus]|uniref:Uncharacterized protein n=1 Tax=Dibothriocephalus latus TaxID=60516 RepID=A0A3P7ML36_DIBLA|nr:unnamed protein product [Dibothriocephalus latus]